MEIVLKNFRCHINKTIQIPSNGLVLLSGDSGVGKSTILNAIAYAYYGKLRKPYSHGTTKCSVTINTEGYSITRTNRPNRLVVSTEDDEYEDDVAQAMINDLLGMEYQEFMTSSYVVQRLSNSIISQPPAQQLELLKTISFTGDEAITIKKRISSLLSERKETFTRLSAQHELVETRLEELLESLPPKPTGISESEVSKLKKKRSEYKSKLELAKKKKKKKKIKLKELKEKEGKRQSHNSVIDDYMNDINLVESSLERFDGVMSLEELSEMNNECMRLKEHLKVLSTKEKYISKKKLFDNLLRDHEKQIETKTSELGSLILSKSEEEAIEREISDLEDAREGFIDRQIARKRYNQALNRIELTNANFNEMYNKKGLEALRYEENRVSTKIKSVGGVISSERYTCPSCSENLCIEDKKLKIVPKLSLSKTEYELIKKEHKTLRGWLEQMEADEEIVSEKPQTEEYDPRRLSHLISKLEKSTESRGELSRLTREDLPPSLCELKSEIEVLKKRVKKLPIKMSKEELHKKIDELTRKYSNDTALNLEKHRIQAGLKERRRELTNYKDTHGEYRRIGHEKDILELETSLGDIELKTEKLMERYEKVSLKLEAFQSAEKYFIMQSEIEKCESRLDKIEHQLDISRKNLEGIRGLEVAAKEAEVLSLGATIDSINSLAKEYMTEMFTKPISIELSTSKKLSSRNMTKISITTNVSYKGNVYSGVEELSGGERQRVELAFLLAVNELLGSQILMLDECLNNLDSEINMEVLSNLRSFAENKLILVVSHEAVQGTFDSIIELQ